MRKPKERGWLGRNRFWFGFGAGLYWFGDILGMLWKCFGGLLGFLERFWPAQISIVCGMPAQSQFQHRPKLLGGANGSERRTWSALYAVAAKPPGALDVIAAWPLGALACLVLPCFQTLSGRRCRSKPRAASTAKGQKPRQGLGG